MEEKKNKRIGAYKILSDETLKGEMKADLIERIRILEHNWAATENSLNIQAKNCEILLKQKEKDTAKEILQIMKAYDEENYLQDLENAIAKRYGVEVE